MKPFSMTLNVAFDDPESLQRFLENISGAFRKAEAAIDAALSTSAPKAAQPEPASDGETVKRGRGRPAKDAQAPTPVAVEPAPSPAPADSGDDMFDAPPAVPAGDVPTVITLDSIMARAQAYSTAKGAPELRKVLISMGAGRVRDVKPGDYKDLWGRLTV